MRSRTALVTTVTCLKCNLLPCNKRFYKPLGAYLCGKQLAGPGPERESAEKHFVNVFQFDVVTLIL
jgi:hypothetical protein